MEEQLIQAVEIASNPLANAGPELTSQALQFLEHLKSITEESWSVGWAVWSARNDGGDGPKYSHNARMFGLMLVDDFLENKIGMSSDPAAAVATLQEAAVNYIRQEYVVGSGDQAVPYIKNKFAQVLAVLLLQTYSLPPPFTLLPTLLALFRAHPSSSPSSSQLPLNPFTTDLVLRVLHDLSVTLGSDATLRAVRSRERLQRDAAIRDEIRANHAANIAESVWSVVEQGFAKVNEGPSSDANAAGLGLRLMSYTNALELTAAATKIIEDYVSWIDISLIVTGQTVPLLFQLLHHSLPSLRTAAADALHGIISKGMKPADKLSLAQALNLTEVLPPLESRTRTSGGQDGKGKGATGGDDSDANVEFREHLAKLTNGLALEMCKIIEDDAVEEATRASADALLNGTLPVVLCFLSDEYDDASEQMLSGIGAILNLYKKAKRRGAALPPVRGEFLSNLINVVLQKMRFDDEAEWCGASFGAADDDDEEEDEDDAKFMELRKNLQTVIGAIAAIDEGLFSTTLLQLVLSTFASFEASVAGTGPQLQWQQVELALFVIHFYGDLLTTASAAPKTGLSPATFVQLPESEAAKGRSLKIGNNVLATLPLSTLGEMVQKLVQSNVSAFPHPAVQLQFFECVIRYSNFFAARSGCVSEALPAFLDWRGIHHEKVGVRKRVNYLFYRFIRDLRSVGAVPLDIVQRLLEGMQDLLVVQAELPEVGPDEDPLQKATAPAGHFDSQLYLFETSGILVSLLHASPEDQVMLSKAIAEPLIEQLQQAVQGFQRNSGDLRLVLQVHHLMLALSSLAKGFPDVHPQSTQPEPQWVVVFKSVTEQILVSLNALNQFAVIREAARGAFARIVSTCGKAVLPYIPGLIDALLSHVSAEELIDFINFLGLVVNKYKESVRPIVDELFLLLVERIFFFLNQEIAGTDDAVRKAELQRAYINFLSAMVASGMEGVFVSDKNRAQLETLLQSVVYYSTASDPSCQRTAISILHRLVTSWGGSEAKSLPGFERFIYETLVGLVFEAPAKETFDLRDAQSQIVLSEIALLMKTIYQQRGEELVNYLLTVYFPRIQCPNELAQDFVAKVKTLEAKQFKAYLQEFILKSKGA
ncbi:pre-tRNA nuclear export protein [Thecaphora frezii]